MTTLAFDTHRAVKALRHAGFSDEQAEAVTEQISAAIGESVATKADLAAVRADVAGVRADMEKLELRLTLKLYAAVAAGVGLVKALDWLVG